MLVAALRGEIIQRYVETEEVVLVRAAGALAHEDVLRQLLRVLGPNELGIVGRADVDEGADGRGAVGGLKWRVVDGVAVDLADVEVVLDLGDLFGLYAVGDAPDLVRRRVVVVGELFPVGALEEGDDAAGRLGRAAVIFTGRELIHICGVADGGSYLA